MSEFDPHAAIARLAAAGKECLGEPTTTEVYRGLWCRARSIGSDTQYSEWAKKCGGGCGGTGRIAPFASLRVNSDEHRNCSTLPQVYDVGQCETAMPFAGNCEGRGWIPEPNVRAACWEVWKVISPLSILLPEGDVWVIYMNPEWHIEYGNAFEGDTAEEAVLTAAEAFLEVR